MTPAERVHYVAHTLTFLPLALANGSEVLGTCTARDNLDPAGVLTHRARASFLRPLIVTSYQLMERGEQGVLDRRALAHLVIAAHEPA